ncbi:MAG: hypothetical protein AB8F34_13865 [Akkermansiaceae bacterium]
MSDVDGIRYVSKVSEEAFKKSGGHFSLKRIGKDNNQESYVSEPKGIPLIEALQKAEIQAKKILGDNYTGKDGKWKLKYAKREFKGEDSLGYYFYRFSYTTRAGAYSNEKWFGSFGNLQIIVLLDGSVIEPTKMHNPVPRSD